MKRTTFLTLATLASAAAALAIDHAAAAEKSEAAAKVAQLPFPIGELTCAGKTLAMEGHPGHATTATARVEKVLGGNWIVIRYDEAQTDANPHPYGVVQYIGYEDAGKRFVSVVADVIEGSGYATGVSAGWKNDAMTFDETMSESKHVTNRDTFTASGDAFTHAGSMLGKDGKWVDTDAETCRKR
jgi:hypothetical protein